MEGLIRVQTDTSSAISRGKINFKKSPKDRLSVSYIEARIENLEKQWISFSNVHRQILNDFKQEILDDLDYFENDLYGLTEEAYFEYKSILRESLKEFISKDMVHASSPQDSEGVSSHKSSVRLPKIVIPTFSGNYSEWISFRDLFSSLIHNNSSLDNVQKLHYLKSHLTGEAEQLVRHIPITSASYSVCWEQLAKRYNNRRYIVNCVLKRFFNQKNIPIESSKALRELLDNTNECLNALKNLNIDISNWDVFVIYILSSKLDLESKKQWEVKICNYTEELPTIEQFKEYLEERFRSLEFCNSKDFSLSNHKHATKMSLHTIKLSCPYCNNNHKLYYCKKFASENVDARRNFVQFKGLCYNCMGANHSVALCRQSTCCKVCKKRHHSLLHPINISQSCEVVNPEQQPTTSSSHGESNTVVTCFSNNQSQVLLATALVKVEGRRGSMVVRSLLDQGSQASFISESAVQMLGLKKISSKGLISGLGSDQNGTIASNFVVFLNIQSLHDPTFISRIKAHVLSKLTAFLPERKAVVQIVTGLSKGDLADPAFNVPNKIDMLLGAEVYGQILEEGFIKGPPGYPIAQKTKLGWILSGCISSGDTNQLQQCYAIKTINMDASVEDDLLRKFWEIESDSAYTSKKQLTVEEEACEKIFTATTNRDSSGRYIVKLPFRDVDPVCKYGNSKEIATKRFYLLERKLLKNQGLKLEYSKVIKEYLDLGHMERVSEKEREKPDAVYLPHHAVIREDKTTSKVRVVFDASCVGTNGGSLNKDLMVGPTLQPDLRHLIMRWRMHPICIVADIVKMYRQVKVFTDDTDYQRILWRDPDCPDSPLEHYRLLTVTFGTSSAPYLAVKALQQVAHDDGLNMPTAAKKVLQDFYMDDLMTGCQNTDEGIKLCKEISDLLERGGFNLQKWCSNDELTLKEVKTEQDDANGVIELKTDNIRKILGLTWNRQSDSFEYSVQLPPLNKPVTKRKVVSDIARLFDPLGWISPMIIVAKIFIQKLWISGIGWDDELPPQLLDEWIEYRSNLSLLTNFRIPRWIHTMKDLPFELHGFSDASNAAYAAVVYARTVDGQGKVYVDLIASKTRVAPIKIVSIPRLELCGAVLLTKLLHEISETLGISKQKIHAWTDSTVVLAWLSSHPSRWKPFIANRVSDILTELDRNQWSYVQSGENPADCASRGVSGQNLTRKTLWSEGPKWLKNKIIQYDTDLNHSTTLEEKVIKTYHVTEQENFDLWSRFSSLTKLVRVVAYCRRFLKRKTSKESSKFITVTEMEEALNTVIKQCQIQYFKAELTQISKTGKLGKRTTLASLNPFVDDSGILRVGGRLELSNLDTNVKHPIIIPRKSPLTNLLIANAHKMTMHGGPQLMINYLRTKYWVINVKNLAKYCVRKCVICLRYASRLCQPMMGQLPSARVSACRPFIRSGVDYAGPISMRTTKGRGHRSYKGYICLFICMATRAIHIEAVSDLTAQGFLAAFKRFVARRGHCTDLWSDNGTNFVGASRELKLHFTEEKSSIAAEIADCLAVNNTKWHFIPPHAPNFGGLWEAGIKSAKHHLRRVIGDTTLTYEEMATVLAQIEACLNSRPISQISNNVEDPFPLTPGHFLVGGPLILAPDANYELSTMGSLRRWQLTQRMVQHFWHRWSLEYLTQFHHRYKWTHQIPEPNVGDIVLVKENDLPPARWLYGRISEKHPGLDNVTRVVSLRCKGNIIKRPVSKLCILPLAD